MNGTDIVIAARGWVGTPFRHQGRSKGRGVDCIGVAAGVARELELLPEAEIDAIEARYAGYGTEPAKGRLTQALDDALVRVPRRLMQVGDVLLMRFVQEPQHIAILDSEKGRPYIIHAYQAVHGCVRHRLDDKWSRRILGVYRFPGVD